MKTLRISLRRPSFRCLFKLKEFKVKKEISSLKNSRNFGDNEQYKLMRIVVSEIILKVQLRKATNSSRSGSVALGLMNFGVGLVFYLVIL